ncbi:hypothetical protein DID88_007724 [Monilinia fructigena]|uniref:CBM1 domain-containing protein n=1 Tax=Monilinia fructigena TaxID=38457 RepID=A0A395J393_9HELO|nr:hypothetical protein DID88_007724 [Monilinia fructigena]
MLFGVILLAATSAAQQAVYGQCGGIGWIGATTCTTGSTCVYQNSPVSSGSSQQYHEFKDKSFGNLEDIYNINNEGVFNLNLRNENGDSYSQTGFDPTLTQPAAGNPLGNPNLQGYTTTGGLNWIGYLVEKYNATLVLSYNFASGGATTNASLVAPYASTVLSLIDQVNQFIQYIPTGPWSSSNTLFGIWMGINDVGNAYYLANYTTLLGQIIDSYFAEVQRLYNAGGRNFLFLTVPPTQDSPLFIIQSTAVQASLETAILQYNAAIVSRAAAFEAANAGSTIWVYDTQTPFLAAINNPTVYGSADATCINSDGVSCLWWNNYHPGQIIHKLIAQGLVALLKGTFW